MVYDPKIRRLEAPPGMGAVDFTEAQDWVRYCSIDTSSRSCVEIVGDVCMMVATTYILAVDA